MREMEANSRAETREQLAPELLAAFGNCRERCRPVPYFLGVSTAPNAHGAHLIMQLPSTAICSRCALSDGESSGRPAR